MTCWGGAPPPSPNALGFEMLHLGLSSSVNFVFCCSIGWSYSWPVDGGEFFRSFLSFALWVWVQNRRAVGGFDSCGAKSQIFSISIHHFFIGTYQVLYVGPSSHSMKKRFEPVVSTYYDLLRDRPATRRRVIFIAVCP